MSSESITTAQKEFQAKGVDFGERLEGAHQVLLQDVRFSDNAKCTIGLAVKDIAARCGVFPHDITSRMRGRMYWLEEDESLVIVFPVPDMDADMLVEIPRGHWWFREVSRHTQ